MMFILQQITKIVYEEVVVEKQIDRISKRLEEALTDERGEPIMLFQRDELQEIAYNVLEEVGMPGTIGTKLSEDLEYQVMDYVEYMIEEYQNDNP